MPTILLADDDHDMVEICERLLPRRGFELSVARNARQAVDRTRDSPPDLILMDMRMPVGDNEAVDDQAGVLATREIRRIDGCEAIPIIALTGHMMNKFKETILEAGCNDLLPKPIDDFAKLLEMIERHLKHS